MVYDAPYNRGIEQPRLSAWSQWRDIVLPLLGKSRVVDPHHHATAYVASRGDIIDIDEDTPVRLGGMQLNPDIVAATAAATASIAGHRIPRLRLQYRAKAQEIAQHQQDMYLGSLCPEPLSPEDIARYERLLTLLRIRAFVISLFYNAQHYWLGESIYRGR